MTFEALLRAKLEAMVEQDWATEGRTPQADPKAFHSEVDEALGEVAAFLVASVEQAALQAALKNAARKIFTEKVRKKEPW